MSLSFFSCHRHISCVLAKRCLRRAGAWFRRPLRGADLGRRTARQCSEGGWQSPAAQGASASTQGTGTLGKRSTFALGEDSQTFTGMRCSVSGGGSRLLPCGRWRGKLRRRREQGGLRPAGGGVAAGPGRRGSPVAEERPGRAWSWRLPDASGTFSNGKGRVSAQPGQR